MNFITSTGYYGTGSSAVTDLLSEYSVISSLPSDFECRIAHDMFGIADLEYYLVDNYHRHNSSIAIKMFKRLMDLYGLDKYHKMENYPSYLGPVFKEAVDEYLGELSKYSYQGGCHEDIYIKSFSFILWLKIKERLFYKFHKVSIGQENDDAWLNKAVSPYEKACGKERSYISYPREYFLESTKKFTRQIFSQASLNNTEFLLVDQLVPPTNTMRYCRYFDNIKVVSVDRDPRDLYYLEKYYWRGNVIPTDPLLFVEWFKTTRAHKKYEKDDSKMVCRIQFEDLVLRYDNVVPLLESFIGISPNSHVRAKEIFNPKISINNIGKWKNDKEEFKNISFIEKELFEICPQLV